MLPQVVATIAAVALMACATQKMVPIRSTADVEHDIQAGWNLFSELCLDELPELARDPMGVFPRMYGVGGPGVTYGRKDEDIVINWVDGKQCTVIVYGMTREQGEAILAPVIADRFGGRSREVSKSASSPFAVGWEIDDDHPGFTLIAISKTSSIGSEPTAAAWMAAVAR